MGRMSAGSPDPFQPARHPVAQIAEALAQAREYGMRFDAIHRGQRWGRLSCPRCADEWLVPAQPRVPGPHPKRIRDFVSTHAPHVAEQLRRTPERT